METGPAAIGVMFVQLEHLRGVLWVIGLAYTSALEAWRRVDEYCVAVIVSQHRGAHYAPCILVHQLKLIKDQQIGEVTAKRVRVPCCLCFDALLRARKLDYVKRLVLSQHSGVNRLAQGIAHAKPEGGHLVLSRRCVQNTETGKEVSDGKYRRSNSFPSASPRADNFALCRTVDEIYLLPMRPWKPDG
jgi:hypothetical protein